MVRLELENSQEFSCEYHALHINCLICRQLCSYLFPEISLMWIWFCILPFLLWILKYYFFYLCCDFSEPFPEGCFFLSHLTLRSLKFSTHARYPSLTCLFIVAVSPQASEFIDPSFWVTAWLSLLIRGCLWSQHPHLNLKAISDAPSAP